MNRLLCALLLLIANGGSGAQTNLPPGGVETSIQGKLVIGNGDARLGSGGKGIPLTSVDPDIRATFLDERISGREMKLVGNYGSDGAFEIREYYVVRSAGMVRLIYYCEVCNIITFSPGECVCCHQPVEPIEVPLSDRRIAREK